MYSPQERCVLAQLLDFFLLDLVGRLKTREKSVQASGEILNVCVELLLESVIESDRLHGLKCDVIAITRRHIWESG